MNCSHKEKNIGSHSRAGLISSKGFYFFLLQTGVKGGKQDQCGLGGGVIISPIWTSIFPIPKMERNYSIGVNKALFVFLPRWRGGSEN